MLLRVVVDASSRVGATSSRLAKRTLIAEAIRSAHSPEDAELAALYLSGTLRQRRTGIGYRSLQSLPSPPSNWSSVSFASDSFNSMRAASRAAF